MARPSNTQFSVGVHLLTMLAQATPGEVLDSRQLAVSPATNPAHVRRVLGHLREAGLVRSTPGAHGGWVLSRPAEEIDLAQVWLAVHGEDQILGVHTPDINCEVGRSIEANLLELDRRARAALLEHLAGETIAGVVADATPGSGGAAAATEGAATAGSR